MDSIAWSTYHNGIGTYHTPYTDGMDNTDPKTGPFHISLEGAGCRLQLLDDLFGGMQYSADYGFTTGNIRATMTIEDYGFVVHHGIYCLTSDINIINARTACYAVNLTSRLKLNAIEVLKFTNGIQQYLGPSSYQLFSLPHAWEYDVPITIDFYWESSPEITTLFLQTSLDGTTFTPVCAIEDTSIPLFTTYGEGIFSIAHNGFAGVHYEHVEIIGSHVGYPTMGSPVFPSTYAALPMTTVGSSSCDTNGPGQTIF